MIIPHQLSQKDKIFNILSNAFKPRSIVIALSTAFISFGAKAEFIVFGGPSPIPRGLSADGLVVVGLVNNKAFRWTQQLGVVDLGTIVGGDRSEATSVNEDGTVVVGFSRYGGTPVSSIQAFRWTNNVMTPLGFLGTGNDSRAQSVSGNGLVVVGNSNSVSGGSQQAVRWTKTGVNSFNRQALGFLSSNNNPNPGNVSFAFATNFDGSVVVGETTYENSSKRQAFRWENNVMTGLGFLLPNSISSATAVSADGSVVVGNSRYSLVLVNNDQAFRWKNGVMKGLGFLTGDNVSMATAVSADGSVVVGTSQFSKPFRWIDDGTPDGRMQSLADWLRDAGVEIASGYTMRTADGVSADGSVVTGRALGGPHGAFIARVSPIGSGSITLNDLQTSLTSSVQASNMTLNVAHTVINGLHSRPLSRRISDGQDKAFWLAGDWGTDKHSSRNGELGIAEAGLGRSFKWGQLNASLGQTWAKQSLAHSGQVKLNGMFLAAEALIPLSGNFWAILGGYTHSGKADINRGYLNAGSQSFSNASPDIQTNGVRARIEMHQAYGIGNTKFSPYADLSFAESAIEAYTENSGGFPARFAKRKEKATELRLGVNLEKPMGNVLLLGSLEAAHRVEKRGADISGEVVGLFSFNLDGVKNQQDWLRLGAGVEGKLGDGKASLMLNVTNRGEAPSYWLSAKWQKAF